MRRPRTARGQPGTRSFHARRNGAETLLLKDKNAVIYGVGDSLGGAVAKTWPLPGRGFFSSRENAKTPSASRGTAGTTSALNYKVPSIAFVDK